MTRAEETARVHELRAAFAASDEPDPWRWFARRELADGWQPIETAPKTSRSRLVWCPERENTYAVTWFENSDYAGWIHFGGGNRPLSEEPTQWRPIPTPPGADPQSAAEPPRDRTDFAWDVIGESEAF